MPNWCVRLCAVLTILSLTALPQGPGNRILLRGGNRRITVTEKESPYVISLAETPPGFSMRLDTLLMDLGTRLTAQQVRSVTKTSTSSRGEEEPLSVPFWMAA